MNDSPSREAWVGKHTQEMFIYECSCPGCEVVWKMSSSMKNPETYCPFCEYEEPIKVKEETNGGVPVG